MLLLDDIRPMSGRQHPKYRAGIGCQFLPARHTSARAFSVRPSTARDQPKALSATPTCQPGIRNGGAYADARASRRIGPAPAAFPSTLRASPNLISAVVTGGYRAGSFFFRMSTAWRKIASALAGSPCSNLASASAAPRHSGREPWTAIAPPFLPQHDSLQHRIQAGRSCKELSRPV